MLASCYRASLALARSNDVQTIAFPAISTGAYRFPIQMASAIAVREVVKHLTEHRLPRDVRFVCFDDNTLSTYEASLTAAKLDA